MIYLDPPFNSGATYNILFEEKTIEKSTAQIKAFEDTWHWSMEAEGSYHNIVKTAPKRVADLMQAYRSFLGTSDMMAYLTMMAPRLSELHRVLKPTGSIYLHCDPTAIALIQCRLRNAFGDHLCPYTVIGVPKDLAGAMALAQQDRYQFQCWALGLITGQPEEEKRGADKGIDGYMRFFDDDSGKARQIIVQVKSGHVTSSQIRDLKGTMQRENATIGLFITLEESTKPKLEEALTAGFYSPTHFLKKHPRIQILTIKELLEGKRPQYPEFGAVTFKKAPRQDKPTKSQGDLWQEDAG